MTRSQPSATWPLALALTLLSGTLLYALLRAGQALLFPEPDPARALYDPHSGLVWRVLAAAYGAGMLAPLFTWLAATRATLAVRALRGLVLAAACAVVVQATVCP